MLELNYKIFSDTELEIICPKTRSEKCKVQSFCKVYNNSDAAPDAPPARRIKIGTRCSKANSPLKYCGKCPHNSLAQ